MTTLITRDQMRPGQIVQRVTTYRVRSARWPDDSASKSAGLHKLDHLPLLDRDEWQIVRGRWRGAGMSGHHETCTPTGVPIRLCDQLERSAP